MSDTKIIAVGNQKGGVTKSTSSINIAYCLANTFGKKVLVIDMDSQASASQNLNIRLETDDDLDQSISGLFSDRLDGVSKKYTWERIQQCIHTPKYPATVRDDENGMKWKNVELPFGFDIIPSSFYLSYLEMQLALVGPKITGNGKHYLFFLKDITDVIRKKGGYDYIVIDMPPSLGLLSYNSIIAATDGIIAVTTMDVMAYRGFDTFLDSVKEAQELVNRSNNIHNGVLGILLALYNPRRIVDQSADEYIEKFFPIPAFKTRIPESYNAKKANSCHILFSQNDKKGKKAYDDLSQEIIDRLEKER